MIRLRVALTAAAAFMELRGRPRAGQFGGSAQRFTADLGTSAGLAIALARRVSLGVAAQGGYMSPGPVGRVTGEEPVRVDGGWLGLGVDIAVIPRARRHSNPR